VPQGVIGADCIDSSSLEKQNVNARTRTRFACCDRAEDKNDEGFSALDFCRGGFAFLEGRRAAKKQTTSVLSKV